MNQISLYLLITEGRPAASRPTNSFVAPPSHSLTETDREYYNIVRTEDGLSQYFKNYKTNDNEKL